MSNFVTFFKIAKSILNRQNKFSIFKYNLHYKRKVYFSRTYFQSHIKGSLNFSQKQPWVFAGFLSFFGFNDESEPESELITTMKRGILLIQKEEYDKAEIMLHLALKIAQEQQNSDGITYIYDTLANLALDTKQYEKSEKLFITVLQRLLDGKGTLPNDNKVIHISQKLANIYDNLGFLEKAEQGYQFCLDHLERKISEENDQSDDTILLHMMVLWEYGHFLMHKERPKEAFTVVEKAYNISLTKEGPTNDKALSMLNDLGAVSCMLGNFDKAIEYFEKAVNMGNYVSDARDLCVAYINLGDVYYLKKMFSEATNACEKGKREAKRKNEKDYITEATDCLNRIKEALASN